MIVSLGEVGALTVLTTAFIQWAGWRMAYFLLGLLVLVVMVPAALFLLKNAPGE